VMVLKSLYFGSGPLSLSEIYPKPRLTSSAFCFALRCSISLVLLHVFKSRLSFLNCIV